jgi:aspartate racemase
MRTLGILGGMSWESTAVYYRLINQGVAAAAGGLHSAPLRLASLDFEQVAACQRRDDWDAAAALLAEAAAGLRAAGAEALLIATNTMHRVGDAVAARAGLPLLHIADPTRLALQQAGVRCAGFLGTRFSMESPDIVIDRLGRDGTALLVPEEADRALMHAVIFDELCRGVLRDESRQAVAALIGRLAERGAEAVILGCTEIGLLIDAHSSPLPVFDTTVLHAQAAVAWILENPR